MEYAQSSFKVCLCVCMSPAQMRLMTFWSKGYFRGLVAFFFGRSLSNFTQIAVKPRRSGRGYKARSLGFNSPGFEGVKGAGLAVRRTA